MTDFNKEFNNLFNSLLNNPDIIKEAEESIEEEVRAYRAKKQAEFESSAVFKRAKAAALQQLKEKKLNEAKTKIDSEFKAKLSQFESFLSSSSSSNSNSSSSSNSNEEKATILENKSNEEKKAISEKRKITKAKEREQRVIEHLDSVAITIIFDNTGALYSSDDVQTLLTSLGYTNANELSHEEVQRLVAAVVNDEFISGNYMKKFLMNGSSQLYNEGVIDSYVDEAIKNYPDATIGNGVIPYEKNKDKNENENDNRYNF